MDNLKPYWTDQAIRQMNEIYDFYKAFGKKTIQKRISPIKKQVDRLTRFPYCRKSRILRSRNRIFSFPDRRRL